MTGIAMLPDTAAGWEPNLLPAAAASSAHSTDVPSVGVLRPFGLTRTTVVDDGELADLSGLRYDPQHQVNVTAAGTPAVAGTDHILRAGTRTDTRYDNQWFTDND